MQHVGWSCRIIATPSILCNLATITLCMFLYFQCFSVFYSLLMSFNMAGKREEGKFVSFSLDCVQFVNNGKQQSVTQHVQNCTAISRRLRAALSKDSDKSFSLAAGREEKVLAAGLRLPVVISYLPRDSKSHSATLDLFADDVLQMRVPVISNPPCASLKLNPDTIDFGNVVQNHQTVSRTLSLANSGSARGVFSLDTSELPSYITLAPKEGVVEPKETKIITVNILCREVCYFQEKICISFDGFKRDEIVVVGNIVTARLELMSPSNFSLVDTLDLGSMYYGAVVKKKVTLYNNSPSKTSFITLLNTQCKGYEEGVDMSGELSLACTTGGLHQSTWREQGSAPASYKMFSISPEEGTLSPYETRLIEVSFSPEFKPSEKGWKHHQGLMSRRDYALFLKFVPVGENSKDGEVELGVSATVVPVNITSLPAKQLHFGSCTTGLPQCRELSLTNNSSSLPVNFRIRVPAHYKADPMKGVLEASGTQMIIVVFHPRQFGRLNGLLHVDVFEEGREGPIHTHTVSLAGTGAVKGGLRKGDEKKRLAALDDLSCSIRPHDKRVEVITPFTKVKRHTYTDPDYALTKEETNNQANHRSYYQQYLREEQTKRQKKNTDKRMGNAAYKNETDIGIKPADGISPPTLSLPSETQEPNYDQSDTHVSDTVWTSKTQTRAVSSDGLTVVYSPLTKPCSVGMAEQCQAMLTPRELSMIEIDPVSLALGNIVKKIKVVREIKLKNHLSQHLLCRIKVMSPSLQILSSDKGDSEWRCVLAPHSCTPISFGFSSDMCGNFHQSIECLINRDHTFQIPVSATITRISLVPSSTTVTLSQHPLSTHNTCLEGTISLHNPHHVPAHFSWNLGNHIEYLMLSNPVGSVPPRNSINCHFQYQEEGQGLQKFSVTLDVEDGESSQINCNLEYGKSECSFKETVLFFNPASLFLPTCKTITCINKGLSHAYYEVVGCQPPIQGVEVMPPAGCIPARGRTELTFQLTASELGSFESWFKLKLKGGKMMDLRVTGSIELPRVYIDLDEFKFGSVYCGSTASLPFTVYNKGQAHVHLTFNLTSLPDFKVTLPTNADPYKGEDDLSTYSSPDGLYQVFLPSNSSVQCDLIFSPKDVAAYDFIIPVLINGNDPIDPPLSQWPPSSNNPQIAIGRPLPTLSDTPKRRVMATTLVAPLLVKNSLVTSKSSEESSVTRQHEIQLCNISSEPVTWALGDFDDDSLSMKRIEDGTFKFFLETGATFYPPSLAVTPSLGDTGHLLPNESYTFFAKFSPLHHGQYTASVPLYLNGNSSLPYRHLELEAELLSERILTSPTHVALHPVPLGVTVEAQFTIILQGFSGTVHLEATLPDHFPEEVQISVNMPEKFEKQNHQNTSVHLSCEIIFCSDIPVSITDSITFLEKRTGKKKKIPFSVCADNSLFSVYEFISDNLNNCQYKRDPATGIPLLHLPSHYHTSSRISSVHSTLSSSTTLRAGSSLPQTLSSCSTGYGGLFLTDCNSYMCRYLSLFGWPEGLRSVQHPTDLVECVGKEFTDTKNQYSKALSTSRGPLLDLVRHLCGRLPPGIPQTPTPCKTRTDRINRHYQELTITLAFLRSQGALLWIVVPESLMDWKDFCHWRDNNPTSPSFLKNATLQEFHEIARQAWSHLLGQILKVLVVPRLLSVVPSNLKGELKARENQLSNIYNKNELLLLMWMKRIVEKGGKLFHNIEKTHKVDTFDLDLMDCTVLASVIAAYAPYMVDRYFSKMYSEPLTPEQVNHNALLLVAACREMSLNYDIQPSDLSAPNPIGLALFTAYLFHSLPSYKPETIVTLEGELGTRMTQKVKIENPSARPLVYKTLILGDAKNCFAVGESITIPSRSSEYLQIEFSVRFLSSCSAILLLLSRTGVSRPGRTIAFTLKGKSTLVKPAIISSVEASLYEVLTIPINFANVFGKAGEFQIHLTEGTMLQESPVKKKRAGKVKGPSPSPLIPTERLQVRSTDNLKVFHSKVSSVFLESQEKISIFVECTPLKMQPRQCAIWLSCESLGDIVMLISTTVNLPVPTPPITNGLSPSSHVNDTTRILHLKAIVGEVIREEIVIENRNRAFEAAILGLSEWEMEDEEKKRRRDTKSLQFAALQKAMEALTLDSSLKTHWDKMTQGSDELHFSVGGDSDFFTIPGKVSVPAKQSGKAILPVEFSCDTEGRYSCRIVLHSPHDVRVYCVEVMVMDKGRIAELEIITPALEPVTQKIPIVNPTTIDWPLRIDLTGKSFSGPPEFCVKALTTGYYPLTFAPRRECHSQGCLRVMNTNDNTEHCFTLRGIGERPLAQENITIHTKAKTSVGHILHVPNTSDRTTTYRVECDLDFVSGPSTVTVTGGDVADYPIMIDPVVRGKFSGAVVFTAEIRSGFIRSSSPINEHLWYQLNVTVDPADPLDTQTIKGNALSQTEHTIVVTNPFNSPVKLQVLLEGRGLTGASELFVDANSRSLYTLTYAPQRIGRSRGMVLFTGREDGEIMIEFELLAEDPKSVDLGTAECELGKSVYGPLTLKNPLDNEVTFYNVTKSDHFSVVGLVDGKICVPPQSSSDIAVMFKPTHLGPNHTATITFTSEEFCHQDFLIEGVGLYPSPLPPTTITSQLKSNSMAIISFTNPLAYQASFSIDLKMQSDQFCLFLKQSHNIPLQSGVSLDIPIMFAPDSMEMTYAELTISTDDATDSDTPLLWVYPIHGLPEQLVSSLPKNPPLTISGRAKERVERKIEVCLDSVKDEVESVSGLDDSLEERKPTLREKYLYDLVSLDGYTNIKSFAGLQLVEDATGDNSEEIKLTFNIVFSPSKPLKCQVELHIQPVGNGLWRFPISFEATDPLPDDNIVLIARKLTGETKTSFRLTSLTSQETPFTALFTSSSPEFSVSPSSGLLPPEGTEGTLITITYKPRSFSRSSSSILKIETSSNQWNYNVIGEPMSYSSPAKYSLSRVDDRWNKNMLKLHHSRRNFLKHNIEQSSYQYRVKL